VAPVVKAPICVTLLRELVAGCGDTYRGTQERALLLLGFAGAFRRSELVALTVEDLAFVEEGLVVCVRRSKTDQEGAGMLKGIPKGTHPDTCAVAALQAWLYTAKVRSGRIFRALDSHGNKTNRPMPAYTVGRIIQRLVRQLGLDPTQYGGHSLRAGLVTAAAQAGVAERVIMQQTGHADVQSMRRYIRNASLFRENAAAQVGV